MAYCTVDDVQKLIQLTFTLSGRPTMSEVGDIITNIDSRLDGVAQASGYTVPVTGTAALALMKTASVYGVACAVWHAAYVSDTPPARVDYWCQEYRDFLRGLRKGEIQLPGQDPESDLDPVFAIVQHPARDSWLTGEDEPL